MFNGIIKNTGEVKKIFKNNKDLIISILSKVKFSKNQIGSSVSCSGTCLTLKNFQGKLSSFYLSSETLNKTNFKKIHTGDIINLEKPIKYGEPISGHFVQGHVDTTVSVKKIKHVGKSWFISFKLKKSYRKHIVKKGSIAVNGISLTISKILKDGFEVAIIPQTLKSTNLKFLKKNDLINIEFDLLAKYMNNFLK